MINWLGNKIIIIKLIDLICNIFNWIKMNNDYFISGIEYEIKMIDLNKFV